MLFYLAHASNPSGKHLSLILTFAFVTAAKLLALLIIGLIVCYVRWSIRHTYHNRYTSINSTAQNVTKVSNRWQKVVDNKNFLLGGINKIEEVRKYTNNVHLMYIKCTTIVHLTNSNVIFRPIKWLFWDDLCKNSFENH